MRFICCREHNHVVVSSFLLLTNPTPFYRDRAFDCIDDCNWDTASALLRLSTKYQVHILRKKAIMRLKKLYPDTFEAYARLRETQSLNFKDGNHIAMFRLARETQSLNFLPLAFYHVALSDADGLRTQPGISQQDLVMCFLGRERLRQALWQLIESSGFLDGRHSNDGDFVADSDCNQFKLRLMKSPLWRQIIDTPDILGLQLYSINMRGVCQGCRSSFWSRIQNKRHDIWNELPDYFGLPPWEELKAQSLPPEA